MSSPAAPTDSPASPPVEHYQPHKTLRRFQGRTAELATLRAQCRTANADNDVEAERRASAQLARALARNGILLGQATKAARRALLLGEQDGLREELSAWFAGLGEASLACAALTPLLQQQSGTTAMHTLIRIAVLSARSGDDDAAVDALSGAVNENPSDPLPLELLGAVRFWSETSISAEKAASYYLLAANARQARREGSAAFEDLLRALEMAPGYEPAARAVAEALSARGREEAADEVWREYASLCPDPREAHWNRLERALTHADLPLALAAAFDGGFLGTDPENILALSGQANSEEASRAARSQELLWQSGLGLVAIGRLVVAAASELLSAEAKSDLWLVAGRAWQSRFSNNLEAREAFLRALELSPDSQEAKDALKQLERAGREREEWDTSPTSLLSEEAPARIWLLAQQQGRPLAAAPALEALASPQVPKVKAVLMALAAEAWARSGLLDEALRAIKLSVLADPECARAARVHADLVLQTERGHAEAIERAVSLVLPRAMWCEALAQRYRQTEPALAMAWAERRLVLCPGSLSAARALLEIAAEAGQKHKLVEGLSWSLSQPQPLSTLSGTIAEALLSLSLLDPEECIRLSRRALGILGPQDEVLRGALLGISATLQRPDLGALVFERWFAVLDEPNPDRYLDLSDLHQAAGEPLGWIAALERALKRGAPPRTVLERLERASEPTEPDALFAFLETRALALEALGADRMARVHAHRLFARAAWDLASDVEQAFTSLRAAYAADGQEAPEWLLSDFEDLGGEQELHYLLQFLAAPAFKKNSARILTRAAVRAFGKEQNRLALKLSEEALTREPAFTEALAIFEEVAQKLGDWDSLEGGYARVSRATLGSFGERALHYRAARQFETVREMERALNHAIKAFEAVPADGLALALAQSLAEREQKRSLVVAAMRRVAESSDTSELRLSWLVRAAAAADTNEAGCRSRVQLLLEALKLAPDKETFTKLHDALTALSLLAPGERTPFAEAFEQTLERVLPTLDGPIGARAALEAARIAVVHFGQPRWALAALSQAAAADADLEEFETMFEYASLLGKKEQGAEALLQRAEELSVSRFSSAGTSFLELCARIAEALGELGAASRLLAASARLAPENAALLSRARELAAKGFEPGLLETLPLPPDHPDRPSALIAQAKIDEERGDLGAAKQSLIEALALPLSEEERKRALSLLFRLHAALGEGAELKERWEAQSGLDRELRLELLLALVQSVARTNGQEAKALDLLLGERGEFEREALFCQKWLALAKKADDEAAQGQALEALLKIEGDAQQGEHARQLARLLEKQHDRPGAAKIWTLVHQQDPTDVEALRALEREAEADGNYPELVKLLGQRAVLTTDISVLRDLRLRRARLLLQKLERSREAFDELTQAVSHGPIDDRAVAGIVELIRDRRDPALWAPLWLKLSPLTADFSRRVEFVERACAGFLDINDAPAARRALETLAPACSEAELARHALSLERRIGEPVAIASALSKLARVSAEPPSVRAGYLVEAARRVANPEDLSQATRYAEEAHQLDATNPDVHVCLEWFAYLTRGPGSGDLSQQAVHDLRKWDAGLSLELMPLRSFLLAEALDVVEGGGAGMRELNAAAADFGESGLVALGLAERFALVEDYERALLAFDRALLGDLMLVRTRGQVLMRAAHVARGARRFDRALHYLKLAEGEEDVRGLALELEMRVSRELQAENRRTTSRPPEIVRLGGLGSASELPVPNIPPAAEADTLKTPPDHASPRKSVAPGPSHTRRSDRANPMRSPGGYSLASEGAVEEIRVKRSSSAPKTPSSDTLAAAGGYSVRPAIETAEALRPSKVPQISTPASQLNTPTPRPSRSVGAYSLRTPEADLIDVRRISSRPPQVTPKEPATAAEATARVSSVPPSPREHSSARFRALRRMDPTVIPARTAHEAQLLAELKAGQISAGKELVAAFEGVPGREQDQTLLCQFLSQLLPGDPWVLGKLHQAAVADRNYILGRAVQHVLALSGEGQASVPPPLEEQTEQPEAVQALLFRDAGSAATEALALAWEGAQHVLHRDQKLYGISNYERVPLGPVSPMGRVYSGVARALGMVKVPLLFRATEDPFDARVALLSPPSILATGHVSVNNRELQFQLGAALTAALPQYALLFGLPEAEASALLLALVHAFGPPRQGNAGLAASAQLAEVLWEGIPRRSQRRLQELCHDVEDFSYDRAVATARLGQYRAGLFVCGDLAVAVQQICALEGIAFSGLSAPGELARLCRESHPVADLVRLASSSLYAEMRWRRNEGSFGRMLVE